jgi:hypothetical protein
MRAGRGRLAVGVLALVVAAAATVAAVVVFVRPAAEHRDGFAPPAGGVPRIFAPEYPFPGADFARAEHMRNSQLGWSELEDKLGWSVLRPDETTYRLSRSSRVMPVPGPGMAPPEVTDYYHSPSGEIIRIFQSRRSSVESRVVEARGLDEKIDGFEARVMEEHRSVRAWLETGASYRGVPIIAIIDAPDRETLVRFIESLSFGEGAAD